MLDERDDVTYPDGVQAKDGTIILIHDHQRTPLCEVLMEMFHEEDVRAGKIVSTQGSLKQVIDRLSVP